MDIPRERNSTFEPVNVPKLECMSALTYAGVSFTDTFAMETATEES
jgi:hypothetical protein